MCVVNWCSLRLSAKDMNTTIVLINPREEMGLECGWRYAQKRWAENLEDFEKDSVEVRLWCWEVGVWPGSWGFEIGPCRQTTEFLPSWQRIGIERGTRSRSEATVRALTPPGSSKKIWEEVVLSMSICPSIYLSTSN